ncbi:FAD-dependent oxidoreductase, partial [Staphylococcus aureus]|uniref:FAD-dependent oxidoreductase n=1 Tax=Staphylococcus aureus TaxID=1280 RepID=UPI0037D9F849
MFSKPTQQRCGAPTKTRNKKTRTKARNLMRIAIIGGGLTGLTLAYYLQKAGVAYDLLEASDQPGGNLRSTTEAAGYQLEAGPN